eukprot:TRINITY_DN11125_c0_g4_i3.p4 TRINITY_DN11125_c0_g4~~TRINITY_DN11125_c0_g4_i3.p4  ORF type:complete len:123 (-),score=26.64 TRINITY_DN11125_c0_g4_i3:653-1021(-)
MKLITHNMLACNAKGVENGFPLIIEPVETRVVEIDYDEEFLKNIFNRIQYGALKQAADQMGYSELPEEANQENLQDEDFLKKFHHALMEIQLEEGNLICPESGRKFSVQKGVPNMLLNENEI